MSLLLYAGTRSQRFEIEEEHEVCCASAHYQGLRRSFSNSSTKILFGQLQSLRPQR